MRLNKIIALMYRDLQIIRRTKWRVVEFLYYPVTWMLMWGFFAVYSMTFSKEIGLMMITISMLWNFAYVAQYTATIQTIEDILMGSFKQLLLSGVTWLEYMVSKLLMASVASVAIFGLMLFTASFFNTRLIHSLGMLISIAAVALIVSLALAVLVTSLIISLGKNYSFLSWSSMQAMVLLSAPFFPKELFPGVVKYISEFMPYTYVFEAARNLSVGNPVHLWKAVVVAAAYFIIAWPIYIVLFRKARKSGKLVRFT